ncbi:MAG TPA: hypothetical protein VFQ53_33880 [Kofleriaceae bacterium]|nr:hypothetical protein [Kofleriaceae bacterium]
MPANRSVFYGFGAWVGQITGPSSCLWWSENPATMTPAFDPARLIPVELSNNPSAARAGRIAAAQIEVDDAPVEGGATKIGPRFPSGVMVQGCWLESGVYDRLPAAKKPARVPAGYRCHDYEVSTVVYWDGPLANRRFWGLHAKIEAEAAPKALVSIWHPGTGLEVGAQPAGAWWLDLALVAHPIETGFTQIGLGTAPKEGPLFLDDPTARSISIYEIKLPKSAAALPFRLRGCA